jgi:hypothetical protein
MRRVERMAAQFCARWHAPQRRKMIAVEEHPLQDKWTLWYHAPHRSRGWLDALRELAHFDSIAQMWRLLNNIKPPSALPLGADCCFFKDGIAPKWEEAEHRCGGIWSATLSPGMSDGAVDTLWLFVLLTVLGADMADAAYEAVTGVWVAVRARHVRIELWCRFDAPLVGASLTAMLNSGGARLQREPVYVACLQQLCTLRPE